jgi:hypothetical protein
LSMELPLVAPLRIDPREIISEDSQESHHRMIDRQKYLARHRKYNRSEKGLERCLRYWHAKGDVRRRIKQCERVEDWSFAMYLRGEITLKEMQEIDPLPKFRALEPGE